MQRVLVPGGWLAFSVETTDGASYRLQSTGRYAHAPDYLAVQLARSGFAPLSPEDIDLRVEHGRTVAGQLWVARREDK